MAEKMLNEDEKQALKAILEGDTRPWASLTKTLYTGKDFIAEVRIKGTDKAEALKKANEVAKRFKELGFEPKVEDAKKVLLEKSIDWGDVSTLIVVTLPLWLKVPKYLNDAVVACQQLPDSFRELVRKIPWGEHDCDAHELLILEPVANWLDEHYGSGDWKFDPESAAIKAIADVTVIDFIEDISGDRILLAVRGDKVVFKVPEEWREATEDPGDD